MAISSSVRPTPASAVYTMICGSCEPQKNTGSCEAAVLCDHGKGRRGRHQQNFLCEYPFTSGPLPLPARAGRARGQAGKLMDAMFPRSPRKPQSPVINDLKDTELKHVKRCSCHNYGAAVAAWPPARRPPAPPSLTATHWPGR